MGFIVDFVGSLWGHREVIVGASWGQSVIIVLSQRATNHKFLHDTFGTFGTFTLQAFLPESGSNIFPLVPYPFVETLVRLLTFETSQVLYIRSELYEVES